MKKILSILLSILVVFSCTTIVLADEPTIENGAFWSFDKTTKTLAIGNDVKTIEKYAFKERNDILEVVIPENVEVIEKGAFLWCENLSKVTLAEGLKTIEAEAFGGCFALKEIAVPSSVETIGELAIGYIDESTDSFGLSSAKVDKNFTIVAEYGSAAQKYAYENGIKYQDAKGCKKHVFDELKVEIEKICGKQNGIYYKQCKDCYSRVFTFKNKNHNFKKGSTKVVRKATFFKKGLKTKYCLDCKKTIKIKTTKDINMPSVERKVYKNKVKFNLTKAQKGVTHYEIKLIKPNGKYSKKIVKVDKNIVFKGLKRNTEYEYLRRYVIKNGKKTVKGKWFTSSFKTK